MRAAEIFEEINGAIILTFRGDRSSVEARMLDPAKALTAFEVSPTSLPHLPS